VAALVTEAVDVRRSLRVLRRRARWLVAALIVGGALGAAYAVTSPPAYGSTALVLLPPSAVSSNGTPSRQISTEVRIAKSQTVLAAAGRTLTPRLSARELAEHISVSGPTNDIVQVHASAADSQLVRRLADAVANSYIAYSAGALKGQSSALLAQLRTRAGALSGQIRSLQQEIDTTTRRIASAGASSAQGIADSSLLGTLRAEQANTSVQFDQVNASIRQLTAAAPSSAVGATSTAVSAIPQLLQASDGPTRSSPVVWIAEMAMAGAFGATLLACIVLVGLERRDRRPRTRDEIAAAVGAPVLGSLAVGRCRTVTDWTDLLTRYRQTPTEEWSLRKALRQVSAGGDGRTERGAAVLVLSITDDETALALAGHLAVGSAKSGANTALVAWNEAGAAAALTAACHRLSGEMARERLRVEAIPDDDSSLERDEFVVFAAAIDPSESSLIELPPAPTVVLSLSSGRATVDELAQVAVMADNIGRPINGILVADPLPDDLTTGRLPARTPPVPTVLPARAHGAVSGGRL
jgi:capsular polysaccharide biosynthesis protein